MFSNQKGFCGEVNSKNRMGGYVGKTRYIVLNNKTVLFEDENNIANQQFSRAWSEICNQQPKFNDKDELIPQTSKYLNLNIRMLNIIFQQNMLQQHHLA